MTDFTLSLYAAGVDYFVFADNEVPEHIEFGGTQKLAVHELLGGGRVVDALGAQPKDLAWEGVFLGPEALARARRLDRLRQRGAVLELVCHELRFSVVVSGFTANFLRAYHIPYSLDLTVVAQLADGKPPAPESVADALARDSASLPPLLEGLWLPPALAANMAVLAQKTGVLQTALGRLGLASGAVSGVANFSSSVIASVLTPLQDLRQAVQQLLVQVENTAITISTLGGVLPNNPLARNVSRLSDSINLQTSQATLVQFDAALGRMGNNIQAAPGGGSSVTVTGGTLYALAEQAYGDATAWTTIARANGLTDPQIRGTVTLQIPPQADDSGGVLHG